MKNISSYIRMTKSVITANSPVLLVGAAVAGVVTTGILAAKGGYKARGIIDEAEVEKGDELTLQEKVQLTWLCYAVPAVTGASTIASVIGVHTIHTKRFNAMAGLYAITTSKLDDYADNAEELLGNKKTQDLNDRLAQKSVDSAPLTDNREVYLLGDEGKQLCQDEHSGRWFQGSMPTIETAVAKLNAELARHGEATMNEFYSFIGLPELPAPLGHMGWQGAEKEISARWGNATTSDGKQVLAIRFHPNPATV